MQKNIPIYMKLITVGNLIPKARGKKYSLYAAVRMESIFSRE